jgi:hypothetical protein
MKLNIFTIQHEQVYFDYKMRGGYYTAVKRTSLAKSMPEFAPAYDFMDKSMRSRKVEMLPASSVSKDIMPIWGWYKRAWRTAPDLRENGLLEPGTPGVMMHLRIDESRLLLSDFDLWHAVLNDTPTVLGEEKEASWEHIFDLQKSRDILQTPTDDQFVQATFWEIRPEDFVSAKLFKAR